MTYRELTEQELTRALFGAFVRTQVVTDCVRKIEGTWQIISDPFTDEWNEDDYAELLRCLRRTVRTGGLVAGAFDEAGALKGFASVEARLFGGENRYLDLTALHVSQDARRTGAGAQLFGMAKAWARAHGAKKLYISAHSAVESQAFYRAMGCVEAAQYSAAHVAQEPCDCQLECAV